MLHVRVLWHAQKQHLDQNICGLRGRKKILCSERFGGNLYFKEDAFVMD